MKKKLDNKYFRYGLCAAVVIAVGICFYYLVFHVTEFRETLGSFGHILTPVIIGLVLGYLLTPALNFAEKWIYRLCKRFKIKTNKIWIRSIAILLTMVVVFFALYILIRVTISQIIPSIESIISNFDIYERNFEMWTDQVLANWPSVMEYVSGIIEGISDQINTFITESLIEQSTELIMTVSMSVISILGLILNIIVGLIIAVYLLAGKEKFAGQAKKITYAFFEKDTANIIINNFRLANKTFIGFLSGKIVDSIIIGILCFIGTSILKTPYAILVSVIIGVTNMIPFYGPFIGAIPSILLIFVVDPAHPLNCLYFAIFILILQQFDGDILGPRILGYSTGISGFWVIFSITLFGGLFGLLGMIIGVPLFALIYAIIRSIVNTALRRKSMPEDTAPYIDLNDVGEDGVFHEIDDEGSAHVCSGERFYSCTEDISIDRESTQDSVEKEKGENQLP